MTGIKEKGSVYAWDVVNEALDNNGLKDNTPWYPTLKNYVDIAFQAARKADSNTKLFYNDYGNGKINAKSNETYKFVKSM